MTTTDDRDLDLVRKSARELARRFDLGYWREKDKKGEYPWEFALLTAKLQGLRNAKRGVFERVGSVLHPSPAPRFSRTPVRSPAAPETGPVDARRLLESWCAGQITPAEVARG